MNRLLLLVGLVAFGGSCGFAETNRNAIVKIEYVSLEDALDLYGALSHRTVLHANLPRVFIATNECDTASKLEKVLSRYNVATIKDGEKFVLVVQQSVLINAKDVLAKMSSVPQTNSVAISKGKEVMIAAGMIDIPEVPTSQVLEVYADLAGAKGIEKNPDFCPNATFLHLKTQTELTRQEAIHAFDVAFALNGFRMVPASNGKLMPKPYF